MSPTSAGGTSTGSLWRMTEWSSSSCKFLLIISILLISISDVCCELNKNCEYMHGSDKGNLISQPHLSTSLLLIPDQINQLCKNSFLRQLYKKVDGATLMSQNERNLACEITFQTHSILQRFMLRYLFPTISHNFINTSIKKTFFIHMNSFGNGLDLKRSH